MFCVSVHICFAPDGGSTEFSFSFRPKTRVNIMKNILVEFSSCPESLKRKFPLFLFSVQVCWDYTTNTRVFLCGFTGRGTFWNAPPPSG